MKISFSDNCFRTCNKLAIVDALAILCDFFFFVFIAPSLKWADSLNLPYTLTSHYETNADTLWLRTSWSLVPWYGL